MTRRSVLDAALEELYARIPPIPMCDGRCKASCGPIDMSDRERTRVREAGVRITPWEDAKRKVETHWCEALTSDGRCSVYAVRPLICRLYGAAVGLECAFGCRPEGGFIPRAEAMEMIGEAMRIGGHRHAPAPGELAELADQGLMDLVRGWDDETDRAATRSRAVPLAFRRRPGSGPSGTDSPP